MYLWENRFLSVKNGQLFIGHNEATALANKWGTPLYIYSWNQIQSNLERLRDLVQKHTHQDVRICYALKANANREILKYLKEQDVWIDAVSPGEVEMALPKRGSILALLCAGAYCRSMVSNFNLRDIPPEILI